MLVQVHNKQKSNELKERNFTRSAGSMFSVRQQPQAGDVPSQRLSRP